MNTYNQYLDTIKELQKQKKFDDAWKIANKAILDLSKQKEDMWYMMYYQMAKILATEKKWAKALFHMGLTIHYLKGLGGITHEKFVRRLLNKSKHEVLFDKYLEISINSEPEILEIKIAELLNSK